MPFEVPRRQEEIIEDGSSGLLVTPGDSKLLKEAINSLLRDEPLRTRLARNGHDRVRSLFNLSDYAARLVGAAFI